MEPKEIFDESRSNFSMDSMRAFSYPQDELKLAQSNIRVVKSSLERDSMISYEMNLSQSSNEPNSPSDFISRSSIDIEPLLDTLVCDSNVVPNHNDLRFSSSIKESMVQSSLENGTFFDEYTLVNARADGHCIIHALCICVSVLLMTDENSDLYNMMLTKLRSECLTNMPLYLENFTDLSSKILIIEMISYLYFKKYDTDFGDPVPLIMANALSLNVYVILENHNKTFNVYDFKASANNATFNVYIYRKGDHYYACIPNLCGNKLTLPKISDVIHDYTNINDANKK